MKINPKLRAQGQHPLGDKKEYISPEMWDSTDQYKAALEGWLIACYPQPGQSRFVALTREGAGTFGIDPFDHALRWFVNDLQASEYVMERVHQGSAFHIRAWQACLKAQMHGSEGVW